MKLGKIGNIVSKYSKGKLSQATRSSRILDWSCARMLSYSIVAKIEQTAFRLLNRYIIHVNTIVRGCNDKDTP